MPKLFSIGGYVAAGLLIVIGLGLTIGGVVGQSYVTDQLSNEKIVGTPDMNPSASAAALKEAGVTGVTVPSCTVAGETVDSAPEAKCFADYMRVHAFEATGGKTYAEMPRYATADGKGTNEASEATKTPTGGPQSNGARDIWVTQTALSNALYTSFFAVGVSLFAIVAGIALLLTGIGFLVMILYGRRSASTEADPSLVRPTTPSEASA
jgi:hypothetical protein